MGRPTIKKKPMTAAERQRRRRKKIKQVESAEHRKARLARQRYEKDRDCIPMPPGIHFYKEVRVKTEDGATETIWRHECKPLAACHVTLSNDDILALLDQLHGMARDRGLDLSHLPPYPDIHRHPEPGEKCAVSALPRASLKGSTLQLLTPRR